MLSKFILLLLAASLIVTPSTQMKRIEDIRKQRTELLSKIQSLTTEVAQIKTEMKKLDDIMPPDWYIEIKEPELRSQLEKSKYEQKSLETQMQQLGRDPRIEDLRTRLRSLHLQQIVWEGDLIKLHENRAQRSTNQKKREELVQKKVSLERQKEAVLEKMRRLDG